MAAARGQQFDAAADRVRAAGRRARHVSASRPCRFCGHDHRARADGLWLSPTVEWHASLGVASIAKCDVVHIGAFGRWLSLSDLVPKQLRPRLEAIAADDSQLLLAIIAAVFIAHVLLPGWRFLRHFPASTEALRAGRYWSLVLAAFAHDDLMHVRCQCGKRGARIAAMASMGTQVGFNALALSRAAPALQGRLKHDRSAFWCFVFVAASRCAFQG